MRFSSLLNHAQARRSSACSVGANVNYRRNANGQISAIDLSPPHQGAITAVSNISYLPFGPIGSYTLGNGQTITRNYDANYRLTDLTSPALNLHYARDAMGNIIAQGDAPGAASPTETYRYDPLYRLTQISASGTPQQSLTYNASGDRTSKIGSGLATGNYGYQADTHWLTSTGNAARSYDANGNTAGASQAGQTFGYGYNERNRLTVVQAGGSTVGAYTILVPYERKRWFVMYCVSVYDMPMIKTFADKDTETLFQGERVRRFVNIEGPARRKLDYLDAAGVLDDLRAPPGNRLEALKGNRVGQYSIRVNDQYQVCFRWKAGDAYDVEITDYH